MLETRSHVLRSRTRDVKVKNYCPKYLVKPKGITKKVVMDKSSRFERRRGEPEDLPIFKSQEEQERWLEEMEKVDYKALTQSNIRKYSFYAAKALDYYNAKEGANFELLEVLIAYSPLNVPKRIVHMNFKAKSQVHDSPSLFFAELHVPFRFGVYDEDILVTGCCTLDKIEDAKLGRCVICDRAILEIKHPGAIFGFLASSGDDFSGHQSEFMGVPAFDPPISKM